MLDEPSGELARIHPCGIGDLAASSESHEVVAEGDQLARCVEPALEEMKPRRPVEIMLHVVLPVPQQLHWRAGNFRNPGSLGHEIAPQAPAETAAASRHVDD